MYHLVIRGEVPDEMANTFEWYEAQRAGLGNELMEEINYCLVKLSSHPQYYSYFNNQYRKIKLNRFPYSFLYEIQSNLVVVLQFYHAKQNR